MPTYLLTKRTVHVRAYRVEADSPAAAVSAVLDDDVDPIEDDIESEAVSDILEDDDGELKEVALPENAR